MLTRECLSSRLASLSRQAEESPALLDSRGTIWTRGQLQHRLALLAASIGQAGVMPDDRIALAMRGGIETAWAFLGAACYATAVPLNPRLGRQDLAVVLTDLNPAALLTNLDEDSPACAAAIQFEIPILTLPVADDSARAVEPAHSDALLGSKVAALVLHTSGTTSMPKRVVLTHAHLLASIENIRASIDLQPEDRCLNPMPLFHSHGLVAGLLAPLLTGGSVILPDAFDVADFLDTLTRLQPTWYTAVPTIHQAIARGLEEKEPQRVAHGLRLVRSASAALPPSVMKQLEEQLCVPVIETYGMTEATNQITSNLLPPKQRKPGSAGLPIGMELKIVDATGASLPSGATGEVVIRGNSVISRYDNHAEASAASFKDGWLHTGDIGYVDADGYVFLVGRSKELVNRGGEKIAPRDVEEALLLHPDVAEATAFAVPHPTLGEDLAAVVVCRQGATVSEQDLRRHLFDLVAEAKVPSRVLFLDALPKGPTHKPLRVGLAEVLQAHLTPGYVAPVAPFECKLAEIWAEVLGIQDVGRDDNFILRGGDSLSAVRVISRIHRIMGIDADLQELFVNPVLKDQATLLLHRALAKRDSNAFEQTT